MITQEEKIVWLRERVRKIKVRVEQLEVFKKRVTNIRDYEDEIKSLRIEQEIYLDYLNLTGP